VENKMFGRKKKDSNSDLIDRIEGQKVVQEYKEIAADIQEAIRKSDGIEEPVKTIKGNGSNGKKSKEAVQETVPIPEVKAEKPAAKAKIPEPVKAKSTNENLDEELQRQALIEEQEFERQIPASGYLLNVKEKHLPQATVLDSGQVLSFALGNMQENMLNSSRTKSLFALFAKDMMEMSISIKGLGREQAIMVRQQDADKGAGLNIRSDLSGRPGAL
jgi:hypothetical protein